MIDVLFQVPLTQIPTEQFQGSLFEPLINTIQPLILKFSLLVGGLFGIFIIISIFRVYYERRKVIILKDILYDLDQLNIHFKVDYSSEKKRSLFHRLISPIRRLFHNENNEEDQDNNKKKK